MRLMGGEMASNIPESGVLTDSGRSSLALLLQSDALRGRRFLLPDFLCSSILQVFDRLNISYRFYHLRPDLTVDPSIRPHADEAWYQIDYFGVRPTLPPDWPSDLPVVEDGVFLPLLSPPERLTCWAGYTSFRKITPAGDGSLVMATFPLPSRLLRPESAPYALTKADGRRLKAEFLRTGQGREEEYLRLFADGETKLDRQQQMFRPSTTAMDAVMTFLSELPRHRAAATVNLQYLQQELAPWAVPLAPDFPCFLPLRLPPGRRDTVRRQLAEQRFFLPVHWPRPAHPELSTQPLYDELLSLPVDSRYGKDDMRQLAAAILTALK